MISVRRLHRSEWEQKLRSYGCYPAERLTPLNTAEWWFWPWKGYPFTVPVDAEGYCDVRSFHQLMADMASLAPDGWTFPDPFNL